MPAAVQRPRCCPGQRLPGLCVAARTRRACSLIGLPNLLGKQRLPPSASSGLCLPVFRPGKTFREIRVATTMAFAAWLKARSEAALGRYTPQVEHYLTKVHPHYRRREDVIFCGRRRVEYHLNMVGTETLNRVFRPRFLSTERKGVVVPPCLRAQPDDKCQARLTFFGARCAGCTPGCRVHQLTKLGDQLGLGVLILPDDLRVFSAGGVRTPNARVAGRGAASKEPARRPSAST